MDNSKSPPLIELKEFTGLDTQSALPQSPREAHNVQYTRRGGYAPQRASLPLLGGVGRVLAMGRGNDLWVERTGGIGTLLFTGDGEGQPDAPIASIVDPIAYPDGAPTGTPATQPVTSLEGAVRLLPGIAVTPRGEYINRAGTVPAQSNPPSNEVLVVPVAPPPAADSTGKAAEDTDKQRGRHFQVGVDYAVHVQRVSGGIGSTRSFRVDTSVKSSPGWGDEYTIVLDTGTTEPCMVWIETKTHKVPLGLHVTVGGTSIGEGREQLEVGTHISFIGVTGTQKITSGTSGVDAPVNKKQYMGISGPDPDQGEIAGVWRQMDALQFGGIRAAEYHLGRVWVSARTVTNQFGVTDTEVIRNRTTDVDDMTLYYSEVVAPYTVPTWRADNYLTIPARTSRQIVALVSVGRLLYVLGDREVFVVSGNSDRDLQVECIGDSIGCIAAGSVQTLGGVVFYLSDSGVLALTGTSPQSVSEGVNNLVETLGRSVTSTVDHRTETYLLRGNVGPTVCFSMREKAWSTREPQGAGERLIRAGGLPLSQLGGIIYRLDAPTATPLPMRLRWPWIPAGGWSLRKHHRAVTIGITGAGTANIRLDALDTQQGTREPVITAKGALVTLKGQQRSIPVSTSGLTGEACQVTIETSGDLLLLPPLTILGEFKGEVMAE